MSRTSLGLLYPGEMGAAIGKCLTDRGYTVLWASQGRGPATAARAAAAGLTAAGTVAEVAARAEVILSVCPPHAAVAVAESAAGFRGIFVDANAVSPATARSVARIVGAAGAAGEGTAGQSTAGQSPAGQSPAGQSTAGARGTAGAGGAAFVDGGIIGPPPRPGADPDGGDGTRLYLSGERAAEVASLFAGTPVGALIVAGGAGAASAVKMAYAAWTKGTAALLLAARALAEAENVADPLLAEWARSQPALPGRLEGAARSAVAKGWRWDAEMTEIAASMAAAGLPDGFHLAAAEIFRRSPRLDPAAAADAAPGDIVARVLAALTGPAAPGQ